MPTTIITTSIENTAIRRVTVEADIGFGLPYFILVGLPNKSIRESRDRIRSAIRNSKLQFPRHRLTVNLAPAGMQKVGSQYDAAIAVGIMLAQRPIPSDEHILIVGELSLDGRLQRTHGVLASCLLAQQQNIKRVYVPLENADEARLLASDRLSIYAVPSLEVLMHHLYGRITIRPLARLSRITVQTSSVADSGHDFSEIVCAARVKRGLAIAAAGLHSVILAGPPGVGKTALAERLVDILPAPNMTEQVEIQAIRSINSAASTKLATRPFRRLHHAMNMQRIGHDMVTQELMRAHRGVILFDELPEFSRSTLIALRQVVDRTNTMPALQLEEATIPLQTLWVATQNLCSCGRTGTTQDCVCTVAQIAAFRRLIDKPLLDRTDLYVTVGQERNAVISKAQLSSMQLSEMVKGARERQSERFGSESYFNSQMTISEIEQYVILSNQTRHFARTLSDHHRLSGRAYHSLLRVGRTIADLDQSERVTDAHIAEAMQYRADQL